MAFYQEDDDYTETQAKLMEEIRSLRMKEGKSC